MGCILHSEGHRVDPQNVRHSGFPRSMQVHGLHASSVSIGSMFTIYHTTYFYAPPETGIVVDLRRPCRARTSAALHACAAALVGHDMPLVTTRQPYHAEQGLSAGWQYRTVHVHARKHQAVADARVKRRVCTAAASGPCRAWMAVPHRSTAHKYSLSHTSSALYPPLLKELSMRSSLEQLHRCTVGLAAKHCSQDEVG